jgi:hypothetical protein
MQLLTTVRSPIRSSLAEYARMRLTPERASSVNFMALKYPLVHELVIVIADLYLPDEGSPAAPALPGLERVARFGRRSVLSTGWRPWLARHVGSDALAEGAPASIAARCCNVPGAGAVWLATPVHCVAGLASVHLDHRGLLKLPMATLEALAAEFHTRFQGSGFTLQALASGGFLLTGPPISDAQALEPARSVGQNIAAGLPRAPALRRLGAEIEIWLHEHPENRLRQARGELPVTSLWMWGGGTLQPASAAPAVQPAMACDRAYGRDPYIEGLWCARGARVHPAPARLEDLIDASARRSVIVVELAEVLAAERTASVGDALAALDARWLAPAVRFLARGAVRSIVVIANDRCLSLGRHDWLKRWRRACPGLAGLA